MGTYSLRGEREENMKLESTITIIIDEGPETGFYIEHFNDLVREIKKVLDKWGSSYDIETDPDPQLRLPTKEDVADYKAYHRAEGMHSP